MRSPLPAVLLLALCCLPAFADTPAATPPMPWTQLSLATCGVDRFAAEHPSFDGRGVVVAVLDSGVEINAPGLTALPDGSTKVLDVQDFSGEGDLFYVRTEAGPRAGTAVLRDANDRPVEVTLPSEWAGAETFYTWFREETFKNSDIADFDDDGKTETAIPILIGPAATPDGARHLVARFDRNQNRDFGDETALFDYHINHDHLLLQRTRPEAQRTQISIAVNLFPEERRLSLHFDDGGHGTHVAGIAAGHRLGGQDLFNGVAPGANVISCKIGNNRLSGGSTTPGSKMEAFRYAARYSREHNVPVVINLSYGIDSEREGSSAIDEGVEKLLQENPLLTVCTSAGNSGPGLSTVGTPASAPSAISVAALLPAETARDGRGQPLPADAIAIFSSRGAEGLKPDIATPGYATSSVPLWNREGDLWQGTSMASPYAAGLCARLLSSTLRSNPTRWSSRASVKRALQTAASPMEGATVLDYGAGVPDLPLAHAALVQLSARERADDPSALDIKTPSPTGDGSYPVALWRGLTVPMEPQAFTVAPKFAPQSDTGKLEGFFRRYIVTSKSNWATPVETAVYMRSGQAAVVRVRYDASRLKLPGLYVADIELREEGLPAGLFPDAILRSVVIVPNRFDAAKGYRAAWEQMKAGPAWRMNRHFLYIPPYASAVRFTLEAPESRTYPIRVRSLFTQNGAAIWTGLSLDANRPVDRATWVWDSDIEPGVVEIPVFDSDGETGGAYSLRAELVAIDANPEEITTARGGDEPKVGVDVHNLLEVPYRANASAMLDSHLSRYTATFGGKERVTKFTESISLDSRYAGIRVKVTFDREDYLHMTDVPIGLYKSDGTAVARDAMGMHEGSLTWTRPGRGDETVELRLEPAFADSHDLPEIEATVEIERVLADPIQGAVTIVGGGSGIIPLFPGMTVRLEASFPRRENAPGGQSLAGALMLEDADREGVLLRVPIRLKPED